MISAGKPAKTVMIVHEDSAFGSGLAKLLNAQLPPKGFPGAGHDPASDADARLQQHRAQDQGAESGSRHPRQLLQRIRPARAHHAAAERAAERQSIRCSAARPRHTNSSRNSRTPPNTSWIAIIGSIRMSDKAQALKKQVEAKGQFFTYEVYLNYSCVGCSPTRSSARARPIGRRSLRRWRARPGPATSCPTGRRNSSTARTRARRPCNTQVQDNDIKVILPERFANAKPIFPMPA